MTPPVPQTPQAKLANAIAWACRTEVLALKPGNVNPHRGGHGMTLKDFLRSAHAIAPVLSREGGGVGERILAAVRATRAKIPYNTNLGIILLFAPLAKAALEEEDLRIRRSTLTTVLARLKIDDSRQAYQAIRLARPGGMGHSPQHDLREEPRVTLREAMQSAAERDSIARQYGNGFREVFELGLPSLLEGLGKWKDIEWAATLAYLTFLAALPDSLVRRKYGLPAAEKVARKAGRLHQQLRQEGPGPSMEARLEKWDYVLKENFINPGTSADLTAATLLVAGLHPDQPIDQSERWGGLNY